MRIRRAIVVVGVVLAGLVAIGLAFDPTRETPQDRAVAARKVRPAPRRSSAPTSRPVPSSELAPLPGPFEADAMLDEPVDDTGTDDPAFALVRVELHYPDGKAVKGWFEIECDSGLRRLSRTDRVVMIEVPDSCIVDAWRQDGAFRAFAEPQLLEVTESQTLTVAAEVPATRIGGIGTQVQEHPMGVEIARVLPGSPAEQLGLRPGDIVTEVEGFPTVDLSLNEFIQLMTGPDGSEVAFRVRGATDTGIVDEEVVAVRTARDQS